MEKPKLCIDCKHYKKKDKYDPAICTRPSLGIDVVTGNPEEQFCSVERDASLSIYEEYCGIQGRYFEPK